MKRIKKITFYTIFIILFFVFPFCVVHADDCSDVNNAVSEYEKIEKFYKTLDCDNAANNKTIYQCNNLLINRSSVLSKIFQYNDDKTCDSVDLSSIIQANKGKCSNEFSSEIKNISDTVMKIFLISAPFILVLFGSLDFFKIVVESDPRETKKHRTNFIKRVAAFVLLYLTPFFVRFMFSLTPYSFDGSYICSEQITTSQKISTGGVTGTYGGNNYRRGSSKDGQAIVAAAKEIVEYALANDFRYGYPNSTYHISVTKIATSDNTSKKICCATLVGSSLVKAGIFDESEMTYGIDSSPATASFLYKKGWIIIYDKDKLEPGDVLFYHRSGGHHVTIDGKDYQPGHTDIYAGDGKKYNAGDFCETSACKTKALTSFSGKDFLFALRNPGNK